MLNKASFRLAVSLLLSGLLILSACGRDKKTDLTAREISNDELGLMMLSLEDYGPDFNDFELDKESGPLTSEETVGGGIDPLDFGWASGYQRLYVDVPPAQNPPGTYVASSTVYLFDTAEGAADYFEESSTEEPDPLKLFDAAVADEAIGFHSSGPLERPDGSSYHACMSGLEFRRGRLVATVGFVSLEELDNDEYLKGLASALDQRIVQVLQGQAQGEEASEPLVMRPGAVLVTSGERFAQEVQTFQGTFHSTITVGDSHMGMRGDLAFQSPDRMYMTMEIMGETMDFLMVAPDLYVRLPDGGWRVVTDESIGVNRDALQEYLENRGPVDYGGTTAQLENLTQLPDETLDGVTYLHYEGTLDIEKLMEEMPEGIYDPATLEQVRDFWEPISVEVWLDKGTYLPHRMDEKATFEVEQSSFSMDMSMEFFGYNEPVDIPEPPVDAEPLDLGDAAGL